MTQALQLPVSTFLPPMYRDGLVAAAAAHDHFAIDAITDMLVLNHPELVRPRGHSGRRLAIGTPWSSLASRAEAVALPPQQEVEQLRIGGWSHADIALLRAQYGKTPTPKIAKALGRTLNATRQQAFKLKLRARAA